MRECRPARSCRTAYPCVLSVIEYIYLNLYVYEDIFTKIQFEVVAGGDDLVLVRRLAGAGLGVGADGWGGTVWKYS